MNICEHFMKKLIVFCLLVGVVLLAGAPPVAAVNVNIPDANLRAAINAALGANRAANAAVTEAEMKTLTSLTASLYSGISALTGLEKATNLTTLKLGVNSISDISHLSDLTNLTRLELYSNSISDISHLSDLTNLTHLHLGDNSISDISALSGLANLTLLYLSHNRISDISALSGLTNLTTLYLGENSISDISHLSDLTNLTTLYLYRNSISDISHLSDLTNLTSLSLSGTSISDISHLSDLTNLTSLELQGTSISDISHLSDLTNLTSLYLHSTSISDISHLSDLTNLTRLELQGTSISDISHLSDLTNLTWLHLGDNSISDISPLVSNTGLGTGDRVNLEDNPLSYPSIYTHIPALKTRLKTQGVTVTFTNRSPTTLTKVSGDAQNGATSTALANPFVVEVKDGATTAKTFTGVPVTFAVTAGGGTLSATSVVTDTNGRAQTTLTLGSASGTNTVTASVTHAGQTLSVSFTAATNLPPTFTSAVTFSVAENTTAVGTVAATDADSQDSVPGYTITGGADSAKFSITTAGVLTFAAAPNYEAPGDLVSTTPANDAGNNEYIIIVTATSGTGARQTTAPQTLTITVTDVNEAPGRPAPPTVSTVATTPTNLSVSWTAATNTGPAITYNLRYRKSSETSWTSSTYAGTETNTTLTGLSPGTSYEVQVLAKNREGDGPWSEAGTGRTAYQAEDIDRDGDVDITDLISVISNFGSASPGNNDVDGDNDVDAADIRAVFAALMAANAGAPAHLTHTAKTLQDYVQQAKQRGMLDANFQQGLAVLEELMEPFLIPNETALLRNYPNPFNPETWLPYQLSAPADVTFSIYSVNGTLVRTLSLGYQAAGVYRHRSRAAYWDGRNAHGEPVASGVYFYTLTASDFIGTGKMLIRK